jgi:hypothetical protein
MTPAKRGSATPASQGPTRTAPDVPIVANGPAPAGKTKDDTQLLGPEGEPIAEEARTRDAGGDSNPSKETGQSSSDDRAATQARRRPGGLYPLPVWPD